MKNVIIISAVAVIALGAGYFIGGMGSVSENKLQESVAMMKEQSANIGKLAEMMKSDGVMMQESGVKYKDEDMVNQGKDLQAVGEKYLKENAKAVEGTASMKQIMN